MRPYVPSKKVGDYSRELPHYYCNLHNPNPDVYPAAPGEEVTIVEEPIIEPEPADPENPEDSDESEDADNPENSGGNNHEEQ